MSLKRRFQERRDEAKIHAEKLAKLDSLESTNAGQLLHVPADPTSESERFKVEDRTVNIIKRDVFDELYKKMTEVLNRTQVPHALYLQGPIGFFPFISSPFF